MSNLAYALPQRAPQRPAGAPLRDPLREPERAPGRPAPRLVPAPAPRRAVAPRRRPTVAYAAVVVVGMVAISLGQLLLSIVLGNGAYEISALKGEGLQLQRTADLIGEDIAVLSSPQNLAANAKEFGMVNNTAPAFLDLDTGDTLGSVKTASTVGGHLTTPIGLVPNRLLKTITLGEAAKSENASSSAPAGSSGSTTSGSGSTSSGGSGTNSASTGGSGTGGSGSGGSGSSSASNTPSSGDLPGPSTR